MARPSYSVKIRFDGVNWQTVTGVREISIQGGRQDELARIEPTRLSMELENTDGRFSPELASGAYYPHVKPMRRLSVVASHNSVDYGLFYGWIDRWVPAVRGDDPVVVVSAVDMSIRLAAHELNKSMAQQLTGARLGALLDEIGWPGDSRDLDAGQSTLPAVDLAKTSILQHVQDVMVAEDGVFWMAGNGQPTFRDRHARMLKAASVVSQATFGGPSGLPFTAGEYDYAVDQVYNDVRIVRTGGTEQRAEDATSQSEYEIVRTLRVESPHFTDDNEAAAYAEWRLGQHKDPVPRLRWIQLEGGSDDSLWVQMLSRTIGDRITVVHEFPGAMGLNRDFWVEGFRHDITDGLNRHVVQWQLSKADAIPWFVLDRSQLDVGMLAY